MRHALCGALVLAVASVAAPGMAGDERFDYDALGRLTRVVDEQGRVTEYTYDPVGNILRVSTVGEATAPVVNGVAPSSLRRGESRTITIGGTGLADARLTATDAGLLISNVSAADAEIRLTITVADSTPLGPQSVHLANAAGKASAALTVRPRLPSVNVVPAPLAVPPDSVTRPFTIRLSNADSIDHEVTLSSRAPAILTVSPAALTIPAGQTEARADLAGLTAGQAAISIESPTLGNTLVPVFVTAEFAGLNTSRALPVGVVLPPLLPSPTPAPPAIDPLVAKRVGVVLGDVVLGVEPATVALGSTAVPVTIHGRGLDRAVTVSVEPADGVTLGTSSPGPDGTRVSIPVTVAADASATLRQVRVHDAAGRPYPPASAGADRLLISRSLPEV